VCYVNIDFKGLITKLLISVILILLKIHARLKP